MKSLALYNSRDNVCCLSTDLCVFTFSLNYVAGTTPEIDSFYFLVLL